MFSFPSLALSKSRLNPFGTTDFLANFHHIRDMQVDEVGNRLDPVHMLRGGLLAQVDLSLNSTRPHFSVLASEKLLLR